MKFPKNKIRRLDPTQTTTLRKKLMGEIRKRYRKIRGLVREFIYEKDVLGLREKPFLFHQVPPPNEYRFLSDEEKVQKFDEWLREELNAVVIQPEEDWMGPYIESAYKKGLSDAFLSTKLTSPDKIRDVTEEIFLRSAFFQPETLAKVKLLATRAYNLLKGVNDSMASQLNRILAQGLIDGVGAEEIANRMTKEVRSITNKRAMTIARTEIIYAHAEGQLDAFERLNVQEVGVLAEWSTAGDDRVCPRCFAMEGKVFKVKEARGLIPLHPNCRCTWIPYVPRESQRE